MTLQEMFDKAARGLREQKFQISLAETNGCAYLSSDGKRCAWGHVDTSLTLEMGDVRRLHQYQIGLAASLTPDDMKFAVRLQMSHDCHDSVGGMYASLKLVAFDFNLSDEELGPQP